ncbi:MAG: Xaa-Pro dipeptidase, partial [Sulfobacillus thermosulfidooxidans]
MSVYARRIAKLWERPNALVDAYLIVSPENRFYLSGFTGSAGWLLIGKHSRVLLTDFRYAEQAAAQAPDYEVVVVPRLTQGLAGRVGDSGWKTIGIETHRVTVQMLDQWRNALPGIEWVAAAG